MEYNFRYKIGQTVYLKTDVDQVERLVTGISIRPDGVSYSLACGTIESGHYEFEITCDKDILKATY